MARSRVGRLIFLCVQLLASVAVTVADEPTAWTSGSGSWSDADRWSAGPPTDLRTTFLRGKGEIVVPAGRFAAGMLRQGVEREDDVRLRIQGELIIRRDFAQVGELKGGRAEIVLEDGALHAVSAVYLGGANIGADRGCDASISVLGGGFLARTLTLGWGSGSRARFHIVGSKPSAAHLLDSLIVGAEQDVAPSESTLAFTLDARGVTPLTIGSRRQGLSIVPGKARNRARLEIALSAVPPRDDVTLIALKRPARGTFDGLPEGAVVSARFDGREYRWRLTYKGGASKCDIALTDVAGHAADSPKTSCREAPPAPVPLWLDVDGRPPFPERFTPAFPGAEGFGAIAQGGRGGREIVVTNRDDSGPGSLRAALAGKGPRIVRFAVGGEIELKTELKVVEPYLTVDGSDAPAPGITLRRRGLTVATHDVVLRHFRIRLGVPSSEWEGDSLEFSGAERCVADHLSLAWAGDETLSIVGLSDCITVQWCLIAEPINDRSHGYGSLLAGERTTWHHNLWANAVSRVPRFAGIARADVRNNVLYNWGHTAGYGQFERVNYVANFLKPGPDTTQRPPLFHNGDSAVANGSLFMSGNVIAGDAETSRANRKGTGYDAETFADRPFDVPAVVTDSAETAYERVLESVGATLPARDAVDERIIRETRAGTGRIIDRAP